MTAKRLSALLVLVLAAIALILWKDGENENHGVEVPVK